MRRTWPLPDTSRFAIFDGEQYRTGERAIPDCGDRDVLFRLLGAALTPDDFTPRDGEGIPAVFEIAALGERVRGWGLSDRAALHWGSLPAGVVPPPGVHEYVRVPASWLGGGMAWKLPLETTAEAGAVAAVAAVAARALREARLGRDAALLVAGAGPVGQAALQIAHHQGVATLLAVDPSSTRRERVRWAGAVAIAPEHESTYQVAMTATGGRGVDAVLLAGGAGTVAAEAASALKRGGTLIAAERPATPTSLTLDPERLRIGELRLLGVRRPDVRAWKDVWSLMRTGALDPDTFLSRRAPWSGVDGFSWDLEARGHGLCAFLEGPPRRDGGD